MKPAVFSEISALRRAIEGQAAATEELLSSGAWPAGSAGSELPGREELYRQLTALRARVKDATSGAGEPLEVRSELATLLFFAKTLRGDAEGWLAGLRQAVEELARRERAAQQERERLAAQRAELMRLRAALQTKIDQEAGLMAERKRGECRRTLPVITLQPGLTISSMTVSRSRRFRSLKLWLVTLDAARGDVLVRPD